jgi:hypothetical protein
VRGSEVDSAGYAELAENLVCSVDLLAHEGRRPKREGRITVRVVPHLMPGGDDSTHYFWVELSVAAHHEERCVDGMAVEELKQMIGMRWIRTIVVREGD